MSPRYSENTVAAVVKAYGRETAAALAAKHGCSIGAVTHWWAKAKASGAVEPLFSRHGGASKADRVGRVRRAGPSCAAAPRPAPAAERPHCRKPGSCEARGIGHCRGCAASATALRRWSDPEQIERARSNFDAINRDPSVRAKQVASLKRNRKGLANIRRAASEKLAKIRSDPEATAKRIAGVRAAAGRISATQVANFARAAGIPIDLVPAYREIAGTHGMRRAEAVGILRQSYPAAFVELDRTEQRRALRACGPMPAVGTAARATWTRDAARARGPGA